MLSEVTVASDLAVLIGAPVSVWSSTLFVNSLLLIAPSNTSGSVTLHTTCTSTAYPSTEALLWDLKSPNSIKALLPLV